MSSPKPKRPKNKAHHSSFIDRIHRRHDERHHAGEDRHAQSAAEVAPLLRDEHAETSDIESQHVDDKPSAWQQLKSVMMNVFQKAKKGVKSTGGGIASGAESTKHAVSQAGQSIKNNPKRLLAAACGILAAITTGETIDIVRHHPLPARLNVCTTPSCVQAASKILANLHPSVLDNIHSLSQVDSCTSFSEFVCGGFRLHNDLEQGYEEVSIESLMNEQVQNTLRRILARDQSEIEEGNKEIFGKVKNAYNACMDVEKLREYDIKPLKQLTDELKVYFVDERATIRKESTFKIISSLDMAAKNALTSAYIHMLRMGVKALVSVSVEADDKYPASHAIITSPVRPIGLPSKESYKDKGITSEYKQAIAATLVHFYPASDNSSTLVRSFSGVRLGIEELASGIVRFESKLAKALPEEANLTDINTRYNKMTFHEFQKLVPQFSLEILAQELSPRGYNSTEVIVTSPSYFRKLSSIIAETPADIMQAFFIWKIIQEYAPQVESTTLTDWRQFFKKLTGRDVGTEIDRWRICVENVEADLGWILSKFFVEEQYSHETAEVIKKLVQNVRRSFQGLMTTANEMTPQDREQASCKIASIRQDFGFPSKHPNLQDFSSLKAFYNTVVVQNNTYLRNKISARHGNLLRSWSRLGQPTSEDGWLLLSTAVSAHYSAKSNKIVFPAAIFSPPLVYDASMPSHHLYGSIGTLAGHEIAHALDFQGSMYDANGAFTHWWSNFTQQILKERHACIVDQYSRYTVDNRKGKLHINGNLTLEENVADTSGVHAAYVAWSKLEAEKSSPMLPGLEMFNQQQLFWLSYGNRWCSKTMAETEVQHIPGDSHAPKHIRLLGSVANSRDFKRDFSCASRTPVCKMW